MTWQQPRTRQAEGLGTLSGSGLGSTQHDGAASAREQHTVEGCALWAAAALRWVQWKWCQQGKDGSLGTWKWCQQEKTGRLLALGASLPRGRPAPPCVSFRFLFCVFFCFTLAQNKKPGAVGPVDLRPCTICCWHQWAALQWNAL